MKSTESPPEDRDSILSTHIMAVPASAPSAARGSLSDEDWIKALVYENSRLSLGFILMIFFFFSEQ